MRARLQKQWDALRSSYWFVPSLMTGGAVLLWVALGTLDGALQRLGGPGLPWLYEDSVEAARTLLLAVAAAMIGVIGVVFSITMVPLTIAASQFGPRLLRTFLRDTGTQTALGTFIATFAFCMLVLLRLRDDTRTVPQLLVTAGLLLALGSLGVLIYFINHVAVSIQAPRVVAAVVAELDHDIERSFPARLPGQPAPAEPLVAPPDAAPREVLARRSGYVQARDDEVLMGIAGEHGLLVQLLAEPGAFIVAGTPLARVWPAGGGPEQLDGAIDEAYMLGPQRTLVQDIEFGINELVEVAVRALSPAINDPFTAITCLDWLRHTLCRLCERQLPAPCRRDASGAPRLLSSPLTFGRLTDAAFNPIRENGRHSAIVTARLLDSLGVVACCAVTAEQRAALLRHVHLVAEGCRDGLAEPSAREAVLARAQVLAQTIGAGQAREVGGQRG